MLKSLSDNFSKLGLARKSSNDATVGEGVETSTKPLLHDVDIPFEKATFGMGCFWSCDSLYGAQKGVLRTRVGYSGGTKPSPTYKSIGDHTEVIEIHYDPETIKYEKLLNLFWNNHEYGLTTKMKKQYASIIFYHTDDQKKIAEESRTAEQKIRKDETIITEVVTAAEFFVAEDYHQKYRLQGHKDLAKELGLTPKLLQTSHVAARLNGYLVGVGGINQFNEEAESLGLTKKQIEYVLHYLKENEGGGLSC